MKKVSLLSIALMLLSIQLMAQKAQMKDGTLTIDGKDVGHVEIEKNALFKNYFVRSLEDEDWLFFTMQNDGDNTYLQVNIVPEDEVHKLNLNGLNIKKLIASAIQKSGIITEDGLDLSKKKTFLSLLGTPVDESKSEDRIVVSGNEEEPFLIERDRNAHIYVTGNEVSQDHTTISNLQTSTTVNEGNIYQIVKVYNIHDELVAIAKYDNVGAETVELTTSRDHKIRKISVDNSISAKQDIMEYLVKHLYI